MQICCAEIIAMVTAVQNFFIFPPKNLKKKRCMRILGARIFSILIYFVYIRCCCSLFISQVFAFLFIKVHQTTVSFYFLCSLFYNHLTISINRPFSKMAAENLNKLKLKTNTSNRKSTLTLVTLPLSGGIMHTPSHTNVCKFFNFQHIFSADISPEMLNLDRVTKVKVLFLVLVFVFNFSLY